MIKRMSREISGMIPVPMRYLMIFMEFKRSASENELDSDCDAALSQIREKGYDKSMPEGYQQQLVYGIAFYAKIAKFKHMK